MRSFVIRTIINGIGLWVAAWALSGITLAENEPNTAKKVGTILLIAAIFGVINAIIRPVVRFFSFPLIILTLGLFTFVVNALMLELLSWLAGKWHLPFHVDKFWWTAVLGALIISVVSMIGNALLPKREQVRHR